MIDVIERRDVDRREWDAVVDGSPDGWVWALSDWLDLVGDVPRWSLRDIGFALKEGDRLVAVVPLHEIAAEHRISCSGWGLAVPTVLDSLRGGERLRVLRAAFAEMRSRAEQINAERIDIGMSPVCSTSLDSGYGVNPCIQFGYADNSGHARVLDLTAIESDLFAGLSQDAKQKVRKAREFGFIVKVAAWQDALDDYYRIHCETYRRTGATPHERRYFEGMARRLDERHVRLWAGVGPAGDVVAFHHDVRMGGACQYHMGCCTTAALDSGINYLLFWQAIVAAKESGCRWYEIGEVFPGVMTGKEHGLTVFKSKFGGEVRRFFRSSLSLRAKESVELAASGPVQGVLRDWLRASYRLTGTVVGERTAARAKGAALGGYRTVRKAARGASSTARATRSILRGRIVFMRPLWDATEDVAVAAEARSDTRKLLEAKFRQAIGTAADSEVVLTSSGRTAFGLALSILARKFSERRRVLLPSYSCRGLFDPIVRLGLVPDFVEVDNDLVPDESDMIARMGPDVLACVAVHLCGCRMATDGVVAAAHRHGIAVVEDCCHYLGGQMTEGSDFQIFSLGIGKTVMATAGGAVVTRKFAKELQAAAQDWPADASAAAEGRYRHFRAAFFRPFGLAPKSLAPELSTQFDDRLISDVDAQLALAQFDKLPEMMSSTAQIRRCVARRAGPPQRSISSPDGARSRLYQADGHAPGRADGRSVFPVHGRAWHRARADVFPAAYARLRRNLCCASAAIQRLPARQRLQYPDPTQSHHRTSRSDRRDTRQVFVDCIRMTTRNEVEAENRRKYSGEVYHARTICAQVDSRAKDYASRMLDLKLDMVSRECPGGVLVDLCCGAGEHLRTTAKDRIFALGIDFSVPFLQHAELARRTGDEHNVAFVCGNARAIPLADECADALYSISALYYVPALAEVIAEIARVLRPGARCLLDLGARPSLNTIVCEAYPELAVSCHVTVEEMLNACRSHGLKITQHRSFQILPMWGSRPWWLKPLLHPIWTRLLALRVKGRMVDEWIASLPILRRFAFRHVLLCEKAAA